MKAMARFVEKMRGVNHVVRWNFHPTIRKENVAEHSFWVALFAAIIAPSEARAELTLAALLHDSEEAVTGDLPALVKGRVTKGAWEQVVSQADAELLDPSIVSVHGEDAFNDLVAARGMAHSSVVVKAADMLAALMFAEQECRLGNTYFIQIRDELILSIDKVATKLEPKTAKRLVRLVEDLGFDFFDGKERVESISHL